MSSEENTLTQTTATPLRIPLGQALRQLPSHYREMWRERPGEAFAGQIPFARWDVVGLFLFLLVIARVGLGLIATGIVSARVQQLLATPPYASLAPNLVHIVVIAILLEVIALPAGFFLSMALQYVLAMVWRGQGSFLSQCYTYLLFYVPIGIVESLFSLVFACISDGGSMLNLVFSLGCGIFTLLLNFFQLRAVHRLSAGQSVMIIMVWGIINALIITVEGMMLLNFILSPIIQISR